MKYFSIFLALTLLPSFAYAGTASTHAYQKITRQMHRDMKIEPTGDVDTDFVRGMIPHHQGAINMAKIVLKYGKDPKIHDFAEWIIAVQSQEIATLKHWLTRKGLKENTYSTNCNCDAIEANRMAMHQMHKDMNIKYTGNADVDFVRGMIPHHQGAVSMAKIAQRHGRDFEINKLANSIITSQNAEIAKMERWLEVYNKKTPKPKKKKKLVVAPNNVTSAAPMVSSAHHH